VCEGLGYGLKYIVYNVRCFCDKHMYLLFTISLENVSFCLIKLLVS